jgi:hypothetical protein
MKEEFEEVSILDKPAILTSVRIDRTTVPSGYYKYELCNDRLFRDDPIEIAQSVQFNHWGTIIMRDRIKLPPDGRLFVEQSALSFDTGDCQSMKEFMEKFPPKTKPPISCER